jgi:hypothetical protein
MTVAPGRRQSAQSLVEFAVVVGVFLLVLFAAVSAAFHSIQRAMVETAAATGVQIAASGSPNALATPDRGLGTAGVAIDAAGVRGILKLPFPQLRAGPKLGVTSRAQLTSALGAN